MRGVAKSSFESDLVDFPGGYILVRHYSIRLSGQRCDVAVISSVYSRSRCNGSENMRFRLYRSISHILVTFHQSQHAIIKITSPSSVRSFAIAKGRIKLEHNAEAEGVFQKPKRYAIRNVQR